MKDEQDLNLVQLLTGVLILFGVLTIFGIAIWFLAHVLLSLDYMFEKYTLNSCLDVVTYTLTGLWGLLESLC